MTGPELALVAIFASVWIVPLTLAFAWERRHRDLRARLGRRSEASG